MLRKKSWKINKKKRKEKKKEKKKNYLKANLSLAKDWKT
jgi:hypothetical protein